MRPTLRTKITKICWIFSIIRKPSWSGAASLLHSKVDTKVKILLAALESENRKYNDNVIKLRADHDLMSTTANTNKDNMDTLSAKFEDYIGKNLSPGPNSDHSGAVSQSNDFQIKL